MSTKPGQAHNGGTDPFEDNAYESMRNRYGLEKYLELLQAAGFQRTHGRNISEHVFPPAFSYILSEGYMDKFSAEMGWLASMMERRAISALNPAYQKGFLDFVIVAAER